MRLREICFLMVGCLLWTPAFGQDDPTPKRKNPRGKGRLELPNRPPEPQKAQDEEPEEVVAPSFWDAALESGDYDLKGQSRVIDVFRRFEVEPAYTDRVYRDYLEELRAFGTRTRATARVALDSHHVPSVLLSAQLLEFVGSRGEGDLDDPGYLIDAAAWVGTVEAAATCLETSLRLNGGWLQGKAVHHLEHPQRNIRTLVEARLERKAHPEHIPNLLAKLEFGRDTDVRLRAARLLHAFIDHDNVRPALRQALRDRSIPVAFESVRAVAGTGRPEDLEYLRTEILQAEPSQELGYLLHALLSHQQSLNMLLVDEEIVPKLTLALSERDLFVSGAAAAALAEFYFRSSSEVALELIEKDMLHALVRAVGGITFYPQFARFSPLAESSLQRITAQDFGGQDRSAWLTWYTDNRSEFRIVRGSLPLEPDDYDRLQVSWSPSDGQLHRLIGHAVENAEPGSRVLGRRDMEELVAALEEARILDNRVLPGTYGPADEDLNATLEIEVDGRRKPLRFRGDSGFKWLPPLLQDLTNTWKETSWQLLASHPDRASFVKQNLFAWDGAGKDERNRLLVTWSQGRLSNLGDEDFVAWAQELRTRPGLESAWKQELALEFLRQIPLRPESDAATFAAMQVGLRKPEGQLVEPLLTAVHSEPILEPLRSDMLLDGFVLLGAGAAESSLSDSRLAVRVAAARALGRTGPSGFQALLRALQDENPLVVRMAARSLGELGDSQALPYLVDLAEPYRPKEVRKDAIWALGELGLEAGLASIVAGAKAENAAVRITSVSALGRVLEGPVTEAFVELFPDYAATSLEITYLRALELRGAGVTREVLRAHLDSIDTAIARRAAIHAGRLGDPQAGQYLITMLADAPRDEEVLTSLTYALAVDFRHNPDPAGTYLSWWRIHGGKPPQDWLRSGASFAGYELPESFADADSAESVPALLRVLERGPIHLRASAAFYLHQLTQVDTPALHGSTPRPVVQQVAQAWHEWLQARGNG